ncbi:MAG TPA: hypothetical protein VFS20_16325 [Longimicrobium sp.]|nr:hypothetical protein [Longimicrobium sp.]
MATDDPEDLETLREQLKNVALDTARELLSEPPDPDRVDRLDALADELRRRIRALEPPRIFDDLWRY